MYRQNFCGCGYSDAEAARSGTQRERAQSAPSAERQSQRARPAAASCALASHVARMPSSTSRALRSASRAHDLADLSRVATVRAGGEAGSATCVRALERCPQVRGGLAREVGPARADDGRMCASLPPVQASRCRVRYQ